MKMLESERSGGGGGRGGRPCTPALGLLLALTLTDLALDQTYNFFLGIGKLFFLEKLDVCNNYLKTLSPAIGQLISLTLLHLVNNELSVLPKGKLILKIIIIIKVFTVLKGKTVYTL